MNYKVMKPFVRKGVAYQVGTRIDLPERDAVYLWMGGFLAPVFEARPAERPRRRAKLEPGAVLDTGDARRQTRGRGRPANRNPAPETMPAEPLVVLAAVGKPDLPD